LTLGDKESARQTGAKYVQSIRHDYSNVMCRRPVGRTNLQNIVLVHGAWADGSGWSGVHDNLVRDSFKVTIVQEPETFFQDDVNAVKRILAPQDGPSILVATAMGSRNYGSRHGFIGCRIGLCSSAQAHRWKELIIHASINGTTIAG
jgi:hypothetical protein